MATYYEEAPVEQRGILACAELILWTEVKHQTSILKTRSDKAWSDQAWQDWKEANDKWLLVWRP